MTYDTPKGRYTIEREFGRYVWAHEDYDGPGDPRCGWGYTVEDCQSEIDEWEADPWWPGEDENAPWSGGFAENH